MAGAPAMYETPELMQQAIDLYFKTCEAEKKQPTITKLCYELGFESRQSFYDYEKREGFSYIIKRARLRVESGYEERLQTTAPTGAIFALKNMGWKDQSEVDHTSGGEKITGFTYLPPKSDEADDTAKQETAPGVDQAKG